MSKYGGFSGPYFPVYGPEKTPYLDTFHAMMVKITFAETFFDSFLNSFLPEPLNQDTFTVKKSNSIFLSKKCHESIVSPPPPKSPENQSFLMFAGGESNLLSGLYKNS